jgi:hypothetical protein
MHTTQAACTSAPSNALTFGRNVLKPRISSRWPANSSLTRTITPAVSTLSGVEICMLFSAGLFDRCPQAAGGVCSMCKDYRTTTHCALHWGLAIIESDGSCFVCVLRSLPSSRVPKQGVSRQRASRFRYRAGSERRQHIDIGLHRRRGAHLEALNSFMISKNSS